MWTNICGLTYGLTLIIIKELHVNAQIYLLNILFDAITLKTSIKK